MNILSSLFKGSDNLDTYLLLILIFTLLQKGDDSGTVFALGYLLLVSDDMSENTTPSECHFHSSEVSVYPPREEYPN